MLDYVGYLIPIIFLGSTWGFISLMGVIARIRGWNRAVTMWLSGIFFAAITWSIWNYGDSIASGTGTLFLIIILTIFFVVGIASPLIIRVLKLTYPDIFSRGSSLKPANEKSVRKEEKPKTESQPTAIPANQQKSATGIIPTSAKRSDTKVFISYRRSDSADISGRIYDRLVAKFGRDAIFKDVDSIPLGIDFKAYLDQHVGNCAVQLVIIGDHWLDAKDFNGARRLDDPADFVRIEIESALERDIPVIPLLVRGASVPAEGSLPVSLRKLVFRNGIPIRSDPDFHRDMDRLIAGLEKYVR